LTQSASAGASSRSGVARGYDLTVRMDDGTMQTFTDNTNRFRAGDRIRITTDGEIVRP